MLDSELNFAGHQALLDMRSFGPGMYRIVGLDEKGNKIFQDKVLKI
mgnify:FL=1